MNTSAEIDRATTNGWALRTSAVRASAAADSASASAKALRRRAVPLVSEGTKHTADLTADVKVINEHILSIGDLFAGIEKEATRLAAAKLRQKMLHGIADEMRDARASAEGTRARRRANEEHRAAMELEAKEAKQAAAEMAAAVDDGHVTPRASAGRDEAAADNGEAEAKAKESERVAAEEEKVAAAKAEEEKAAEAAKAEQERIASQEAEEHAAKAEEEATAQAQDDATSESEEAAVEAEKPAEPEVASGGDSDSGAVEEDKANAEDSAAADE